MTQPPPVELPHPPTAVRVIPGPAGGDNRAAGSPDAPDNGALQSDQAALETERAELARARQTLERAAAQVAGLEPKILADAEQHLLDLAIEIARKVLMQEIQAGRYEIDPIVTEALLHVPARQVVVAHLHPDDWARCQRASDGSGDGAGTVRFVADASVPRAACVLETPQGVVQSVVEDHLERIAEDLGGEE